MPLPILIGLAARVLIQAAARIVVRQVGKALAKKAGRSIAKQTAKNAKNALKKSKEVAKRKKKSETCKTCKKPSKREKYLGRTPGKSSRTGREVIARMRSEGTVRGSGKHTQFKASNGKWYNLKNADMSHKTDAVSWWNRVGRKYGAKSPEVRKWMLDSKNYKLDHFSINRSAGGKLKETYKPPLK